MFGNLINKHDWMTLISKFACLDLSFLRWAAKRSRQRVHDAWDGVSGRNPNQWWDIPLVRERWNYLISGDATISSYGYIAQTYFANRQGLHALSLGCGTGQRELNWARLGIFEKIDAFDLSESRIAYAIEQAKRTDYAEVLNYQVGDIYEIESGESCYDAVMVEQSLHHFSPLQTILERISKWIKADGYFIVDEFVGPSRFQWTDKQLKVTNGLLSILPTRYRILADGKTAKEKVFKPSRLRMICRDPSEAVESSRIIPLLNGYFNVVDIRPYGGTILQPLLSEIAQNFLSDDTQTRVFLKLCFDIEDCLLENREIDSDFVVAICRKKM